MKAKLIKEQLNSLNETKAFGQLKKLNKKLFDDTVKLESSIGDDVLKLIDDAIKDKKLNYKNKEELELVHLIILDLLLERYLNKKN